MANETQRANEPAPVDRLTTLWRRLKDHRIAQWTVGYVAVAYGIQHGVTLTSEALDWPHAVTRVSMVLLALGLPVAMTLAWYHGERSNKRISGGEAAIVSVLLVLVSLVFYVFVRPAPDAAPAFRTASVVASAPSGGVSLAVLPFLNLSGDSSQEFFSDGMTEEITSALAKVPNLRVVGRTSAFQFKGTNKDLRNIGQALSATHLIEGSVRKDGNQLRITAQLIKADDGTHLWTESYDRELKGVFKVQEEIATAIATALSVPLGLKQGEALVSNRTSDTDSYQDYLRARALVRTRVAPEPGGPLTKAAKLLEQVIARDPNYAPAWGLLGQAYALTPIFTAALANGSTDELRHIAAESLQKAEAAAQQAIRIDPNNIDGLIALGFTKLAHGGLAQAEDLYKQALSLDPGNPDALHWHSLMLAAVGRLKDSVVLRLRLLAQEPLVPVYNDTTALVLWEDGRNDEAIAILKGGPPRLSRIWLAQVYASTGHYNEAAAALRGISSGIVLPEALTETIRLLESAPAQTASPQMSLSKGLLGFVYLYAGAPDRALDFFEGLAEAGVPALGNAPNVLWAPAYTPLRATERFKAYARKAGMVDYWKARGWPPQCHPTFGDDFECG